MIFVLLGTQDAPFTRLIDMIHELVLENDWTEQVIIQSGTTKVTWEHPNVLIQPFFDVKTFKKHFKNARMIITHGGAGTMFEALEMEKKIIVVPRLRKYLEHVDDHQIELAEVFAKRGHVEVYQFGKMRTLISKVEQQMYRKYEPQRELIAHIERTIV